MGHIEECALADQPFHQRFREKMAQWGTLSLFGDVLFGLPLVEIQPTAAAWQIRCSLGAGLGLGS